MNGDGNCTRFLKDLIVSCSVLCLIGCHVNEEIELAQLIKTNPPEEGHLSLLDEIDLTFDRPVLMVKVNGIEAEPDDSPPTVSWKVAARNLKVWDRHLGFNPAKDARLIITYEDEVGRHQQILNVRLGAYNIDAFPVEIAGGTVKDGQEDVDPGQLNINGITIEFSDSIQPGEITIRPAGEETLDWLTEWKSKSVTIRPLDGQELDSRKVYIIDIKGVSDRGGKPVKDVQITFSTKA